MIEYMYRATRISAESLGDAEPRGRNRPLQAPHRHSTPHYSALLRAPGAFEEIHRARSRRVSVGFPSRSRRVSVAFPSGSHRVPVAFRSPPSPRGVPKILVDAGNAQISRRMSPYAR